MDSTEDVRAPVVGRSEQQAVETMAALLLGGLVAGVLAALVWLGATAFGLTGEAWAVTRTYGFGAALVAGGLVVVWWLVRAVRRGL